MTRNSNRHYKVGGKLFYLNDSAYQFIKQMNITRDELEREYQALQRAVPVNGIVTYNHAAINLFEKRRRGIR